MFVADPRRAGNTLGLGLVPSETLSITGRMAGLTCRMERRDMNILKLAVTWVLFLPTFASAERIYISFDQAIDAADLIATGELVDLTRIDKPEPAMQSNTISINTESTVVSFNTAKPIRWGATFKIDAVLKGSFKHGKTIWVEGLEFPPGYLDMPTDFNRLPRTGSIWFLTRGKNGIFAVVHEDTVMVDSDDKRAKVDFYIRSKNGLNELFAATTPKQVNDAVRHGVDVNAQDYFGRTALTSAIEHDRIEVVRTLLDRGAKLDLNVVNPLDIAIGLGRAPIVELLRNRGANANGLFLIYGKPLREYDFFLKQGADVNAGITDGYSPITRLLDIPPPDVKERISWLLAHGAVASLTDGSRTQPLIQAVSCNKDTDVAELLLHHGAHVNATDDRGGTALAAALACAPTMEMLQLLLSHGANANEVDSAGWTPLFRYLVSRTASAASIAIVQLLLDAGADPGTVAASYGKSAIDLANECSAWDANCRNIVKLLKEHR
jgi:ankyrin repeat protein